ncbi:hypothetical protein M1437_04400 [Patescibacteria group bacterium]|nr:hypothetical protein [Patescibacteria group bacterium]
MPLEEKSTSKFDGQYCIYCQDQQTKQLKSKEEVREGSIEALMRYYGKSREETEKMVDETMAKLPRWQTN